MELRTLGRTGLEVSAISLGTEYLIEVSRETVVSVVREATDRGVNYFDVLFAYPHYRDNFGVALEGVRDRVLIAGHLGAAETDGQYRRTRDIRECQEMFDDLLARLRTDYLDVVFLSNCDEEDDYEQIMGPGGMLELAAELQRQGKARFIGFSGHQAPVSVRAVESGAIDVLMHTVNLAGGADTGRQELLRLCASRGVGLIAMKPFAGGSLLGPGAATVVTPIQCLSYALAQPGVSTVLPGLKNPEELAADLACLDAPAEERDFSAPIATFHKGVEGQCVYCNHCLPCPVGIDVGRTIRLAVAADREVNGALVAEYARMVARASDCIECGDCTDRCPFKVDVISQMHRAVDLFERR